MFAALERGNHDLCTECRLCEGDGHRAVQILAFTLKERMRLHFEYHVKVACLPAVHARITLLLVADTSAIFHAWGNVHINGALAHGARLALALAARIGDDPPHSLAGRTGARNTEQPLLITYLAAACARWTGRRAFACSRTAAVALIATLIAADLDFSLFAECRFFKGQRHIAASIAAALRPAASAASTHIHAEKVAEEVAENIAEVGEVRGIESAETSTTVDRRVTVLVIAGALVGIHENAISLSAFLELLFRLSVSRIAVRMVLHGQLAVSALDLLLRGRAGYAQNFVVISFCLCRQSLLDLPNFDA